MMGRRGRAGDEKTGVGNRKRKTGNKVLVPRGTFPHIGLRTSTHPSAVKKGPQRKGVGAASTDGGAADTKDGLLLRGKPIRKDTLFPKERMYK